MATISLIHLGWIEEMSNPKLLSGISSHLKGYLIRRLSLSRLFFLVCCIANLSANSFSEKVLEAPLSAIDNKEFAQAYPYNPLVPLSLWEELTPYFLPDHHPIKSQLDHLFQQMRVTQSEESFEKAGFSKPKMRKPTNLVIGRHPRFKEYIFKVYLDTQPAVCEWGNWIQRIKGARAIQAYLARHPFCHFAVPQKWIYPLPLEPSPPDHAGFKRKNFILIVENMHILNTKSNLKAFKKRISPQILEQLYTLIREEGLIDSVYPDNIPFTKSGKIAFIDTEHHYPGASIPYHQLTPFLSQDMQHYWQSLIE